MGQLLHAEAQRFGNRTLFRFEGAAMTCAQGEEQANRLAHVLKAHGIGKDAHVAVMLPNGFEFPLALLLAGQVRQSMLGVKGLTDQEQRHASTR